MNIFLLVNRKRRREFGVKRGHKIMDDTSWGLLIFGGITVVAIFVVIVLGILDSTTTTALVKECMKHGELHYRCVAMFKERANPNAFIYLPIK